MLRVFAVLVLLSLLAGCGDVGEASGGVGDTGGVADTGGADTFPDTSTPDTTPSDTTPADTASDASQDTTVDVREVEAPLVGLKDDPTYLVPGNIGAKTEVTAAGDLVAWLEGQGQAPVLVVWDVSTPDVAPRAFAPPNLVDPVGLALSDQYLAYSDDRYGDPDVFAIDLSAGDEIAVVVRAGAQEAPAVFGSRVAWEDCSSCVTGDGPPGHEPGREIVERDLGGDDPEIARTADGVPDRRPSYGLLGDGRAALAWLSGRATLRMERLQVGVSATQDVAASLRADQELGAVALWDGLLAWRPSPLIVNPDSIIVNPDSMYPSDVFTTDPGDGSVAPITVHAEIAGRMDLAPQAFGSRLAWLEIPPGVPGRGRLQLAIGESPTTTVAEEEGVVTFAMGRDFVVFSAPRADNGDLEDVHVLELDLP